MADDATITEGGQSKTTLTLPTKLKWELKRVAADRHMQEKAAYTQAIEWWIKGPTLNRTGSGTPTEDQLKSGEQPTGAQVTIPPQYPPEIHDAAERLLFLFNSGDSQAFGRVVKLLNSERDRVAKLVEKATRSNQPIGDLELVKPQKSD